MKNKRGDSFKYKSLRQRAEIVLSKTKKKKASIQPDVDIQELFHENELLKTELKLQYEDLKTAKMQVISFDKQLSDLRANTCQNIPSGFVCLSLDGNIDQLNDKAAKLFGRKKNELVSANIKQFITQDSLPVFNAFLTDLLKEEIQKNCEIWLTPPEGALHFVIMEGIISQDKLKYLITMIDISGKKNTGNTLLGNEERYRHLVELSPNGIAIYQEGHFVYVNPAGIKMLRAKDLQDLIGKPVLSIVHPESMDGVIKRIKL
jgi:PAS domain S-box-containing protein